MNPPRGSSEGGAWQTIEGTWTQLHGDFAAQAISIEWHEFSVSEDLDWSQSFHQRCLEICLNYAGRGTLGVAGGSGALSGEDVSVVISGDQKVQALRHSTGIHRFFTIELGPQYLNREFRQVMDGLRPEVRRFCDHEGSCPPTLRVEPMPSQLLGLRMQLLDPPVNPSARGLWYQSKITEILAHFLFQPEAPTELFCEQQHRLNRERCERVLFLLRRDMENPPSLQMLADEVGCSPFYLSRLFAQEIGMGIPKALRKLRIERAAELIREHGTSVTDAAMQVGYSSLGAFNKAFQEIIGCNPGQLRRGGMSFDPR